MIRIATDSLILNLKKVVQEKENYYVHRTEIWIFSDLAIGMLSISYLTLNRWRKKLRSENNFVLQIALCVCDEPLEVPGYRIPRPLRQIFQRQNGGSGTGSGSGSGGGGGAAAATPPTCSSTQVGPVCSDDCRTIMVKLY